MTGKAGIREYHGGVLTWNISDERQTENIPATPDLMYHSVRTDIWSEIISLI